jgi:hypothetical protein
MSWKLNNTMQFDLPLSLSPQAEAMKAQLFD